MRDCPRKVESPIEEKRMSRNMREISPSDTRTPSTPQNRRPEIRWSASERVRRVISQGFERIFRQDSVQDSWDRSNNASHITTGFNDRFKNTCGSQEKNSLHTEGIYLADHGTYIDSVLREIYDAYKAARSRPSNCDGELADHVLKRQPDQATKMMSEQGFAFIFLGITNSRQYFNFPWVALIKQLSQ